MKDKILLLSIFILASSLRLLSLDLVPPPFNQDEAAFSYNSYCLLKTGKDINGKILPLITSVLGRCDVRFPLYDYMQIPSIFLFGLNVFSARLTNAVLGILTIFLLYLLCLRLFNKKIAIISATFLTISPWHIQYSRFGHAASLVPFFTVLGLFLLFKKSRISFFLSGIVFGLSLYTYQIMKLFIPLFLLMIALVYRKKLSQNFKGAFCFLFSFFLISLPLVYIHLTNYSQIQSRFDSISVFNLENLRFMRQALGIYEPLSKRIPDMLLPLYLCIRNYLRHFFFNFLFLGFDGTVEMKTYGFGRLYLLELPFCIAGIICCLRRPRPIHILLVIWLLIFPIPSSLTITDIPNSIRTICALPMFQILSSVGLGWISEFLYIKRQRIIYKLFLLGLSLNIIFFLNHYFFIWPYYIWPYYQNGLVKAIEQVKPRIEKFSKVVITNRLNQPFIYVLFFTPYDPRTFQTQKIKYQMGNFIIIEEFDRFLFGDIRRLYQEYPQGLFLMHPQELFEVPATDIVYSMGVPSFKIVEK